MEYLIIAFLAGVVFTAIIVSQVVNVEKKDEPPIFERVVTKEFAASQLIGGDRFLKNYGKQMESLASNYDFKRFVRVLERELSGHEMTDTKNANRRIADYFYKNQANEKFPQVQSIVKNVVTYGKQASAHISIYYAMFLYDQT